MRCVREREMRSVGERDDRREREREMRNVKER